MAAKIRNLKKKRLSLDINIIFCYPLVFLVSGFGCQVSGLWLLANSHMREASSKNADT